MGHTKYMLERHAYAPEMNKLHVLHKGVRKGCFRTPGCMTISEAKRHAGLRPVFFIRHASVSTEYPAPHAWLNRVVRYGMLRRVADLSPVLRYVRRQYCDQSNRVLHDGSTLPMPKIAVVIGLAAT
jgi:hypothetical protein